MQLLDLVGSVAGPPEWSGVEIRGLTADSRHVQPGDLFAALPGAKADGAAFVADAVGRGAAAVLIKEGSAPALPVPVIAVANPRRELALMAARFYGAQPRTIVAVTGTNGKTSVVSFVRQIWQGLGHDAASLGTVGLVSARGTTSLSHTSPDPVTLHRLLAELAATGTTHAALEASSHGLAQYRLDGVRLAAGAFTNISRDHLDYHADFEDYFAQKLRLFRELLPAGAAAVVDCDSAGAERVCEAAGERGLELVSVGRKGHALRLARVVRDGFAQRLTIEHSGARHDVTLPLVGGFQVSNALVAAGLCLACGARADEVLPRLESLQGARGRLDHAGTTARGAPVFIDYAHTPDALANALDALRPYVSGRLVVVFGCGGDRDRGKRPQMGTVASEKADLVYVTDDNPRSEEPAAIRAEILAAAPGAIEIGDRRQAIGEAIAGLQAGDVLLVAGKGHETGQIVGTQVIDFSDHQVVRAALGLSDD